MKRFIWGLILGCIAAGITWVATDKIMGAGNVPWTVGVGVLVAVLVWFGEFLDEVLP